MANINNSQTAERIILGIDPGTNIMGYGVVGLKGKEFSLISIGIIRLDKLEDHAIKLKHIFERVTGLIDSYKPDELAIEAPFYGKNVQSMLKLGRAQGVAIAAALMREMPIYEYRSEAPEDPETHRHAMVLIGVDSDGAVGRDAAECGLAGEDRQ